MKTTCKRCGKPVSQYGSYLTALCECPDTTKRMRDLPQTVTLLVEAAQKF